MTPRDDTLSTTRIGPDAFCVMDELSGAAFRADARALRFLRAMRAGDAPAQAARQAGLSGAEAETLAQSLRAQGVLPAKDGAAPAPPAPPPELRLIYQRADLVNVGPLARLLERGFGWVFSRFGLAVWAVVCGAALFALAGDADRLGAALAGLATLDAAALAQIALGALGLKAAHEMGHAVSLARFSRLEGQPPRPIRLGLTLFAFMPFPTTDCTAAWALRSRWRRIWIALAGAHVESWIAAILALIWSLSPPGPEGDALLRLIVVAGVSSLMFNLNPLLRLDGYFALSDLLATPNLAPRAGQAAQRLGLRLLGVAAPARRGDAALLAYWAASFGWRITIFAALIWAGYAIAPALGWAAGCVAVSLLVVRPLIRLRRAARGTTRAARLALLGAAALGVCGLCLAPLPDATRLEGALVREQAAILRVSEVARLTLLAPSGATQGVAARLESPALRRRAAMLALDMQALEALRRGGLSRNPAEARRIDEELARAASERAEVAARLARLTRAIPEAAVWERAQAAQALQGAWLSPGSAPELGRFALSAPPRLRALAPPALTEAAQLRIADRASFRPFARPDCVGAGAVSRVEPRGDGALLIEVAPDPGAPCLQGLPSGAAIALRAPRPDASLARRAARVILQMARRASLRLEES